jgi:hypothetical protein
MSVILPSVLVNQCLSYMSPHDRLYINRTHSQNAQHNIREAFVLRWFPDHIIDVLGGVKKCVEEYCFFKGTRKIVGGTDYIDRVRICDLPTFKRTANIPPSVYLSVDGFQRPFAVLRYWCQTAKDAVVESSSDEDESNNCFPTYVRERRKHAQTPHEVVVTLFQRYTDSTRTWCFGTCYGLERMPGDSHARPEALAKVKRLLEGVPVKVGYNDWLELRLHA